MKAILLIMWLLFSFQAFSGYEEDLRALHDEYIHLAELRQRIRLLSQQFSPGIASNTFIQALENAASPKPSLPTFSASASATSVVCAMSVAISNPPLTNSVKIKNIIEDINKLFRRLDNMTKGGALFHMHIRPIVDFNTQWQTDHDSTITLLKDQNHWDTTLQPNPILAIQQLNEITKFLESAIKQVEGVLNKIEGKPSQ